VSRFALVCGGVAVAAALAAGCGGKPAHAVNPDTARQTLRAALDAWKAGEKPDDLKQHSPPVVVQDFDWQGGARLVDYQVLGDGDCMDANLRCPVRLTLRDARGQAAQKEVVYLVGTSPQLTVFREVLP